MSISTPLFSADEFLQIETRMKRLERDNQRQKETILFLRKRLKSLTSTKVAPKKIAFAGQETPLSVIPVEQLSSKQKIDKSKIWTEQEIVNFLMLKTVSMEAYELIKQNQVPRMFFGLC
jgi:cell division septum initiation protein DivIVA